MPHRSRELTEGQSLPATPTSAAFRAPKAADSVVTWTLRLYGWLFAVSGALFVLGSGPLTSLMNIGADLLPASAPIAGSEKSLWLGLTGSMMAMVSYLAFTLARNPSQAVAWNCLLLSKGMSTLLFAAFAAADGNLLFLGGSLVDGPIFAHIFWLRIRAERRSGEAGAGSWTPRTGGPSGCRYEVWFLKFNDPRTRNALWLRYTVDLTVGGKIGAVWYALFDSEKGKTFQGRWEEACSEPPPESGRPLCRFQDSSLDPGRARAQGSGVSWDFSWEDSGAPPFCFVPESLYHAGVAGTVYYSPLSLGRFKGEFRLEGRRYGFKEAPGSVGHLWGRKMGDNWRWAHAVLPDGQDGETVFEILSAQARVGPFLTPYVTSAHLWHRGRHLPSTGIRRTLTNSTRGGDDRWSFEADFGELRALGECVSPPAATVEVDYRDPDGRRLKCFNTKTGIMSLRLLAPDGTVLAELKTEDAAAVETVRGAS